MRRLTLLLLLGILVLLPLLLGLQPVQHWNSDTGSWTFDDFLDMRTDLWKLPRPLARSSFRRLSMFLEWGLDGRALRSSYPTSIRRCFHKSSQIQKRREKIFIIPDVHSGVSFIAYLHSVQQCLTETSRTNCPIYSGDDRT